MQAFLSENKVASFPSGHRLDYEDMHKAEKKWKIWNCCPKSLTNPGEDQ